MFSNVVNREFFDPQPFPPNAYCKEIKICEFCAGSFIRDRCYCMSHTECNCVRYCVSCKKIIEEESVLREPTPIATHRAYHSRKNYGDWKQRVVQAFNEKGILTTKDL